MDDPAPAYPAGWEADVVLSDGATAHLRPIRPDDATRLVEFYARVSDRSKYLRFFAPYPELSARDVEHFTRVDYDDRVAFVVLVADAMIAVGRYDRVDGETAEVAFLVEDAHQGRGLGSVLLEHLAHAARERGIRRFEAEVLPHNVRMITVFRDAGFTVSNSWDEGVVRLHFPIDPTAASVEVMRSREHRAEARSTARLLRPASVAVVGASRQSSGVGHAVVRNLLAAGFRGPVHAVNPHAETVAGLPAYPSLDDVPGEVDLVVMAVPPDAVLAAVPAAARKGAHGLVVASRGYAESGEEGRERQRELVRHARSHGMRVVGPNCLGVINTDPEVRLNASLVPVVPPPGRVGFFSQSGALGIALVEQVVRRGLGLSTFVSAGNRADVSGNDLLQFWTDDDDTDVVLLYLESLGNPRKFARLARDLGRRKPVVAVWSGGSAQGAPLGAGAPRSTVPAGALEAMFRQGGVVRVETLPEMFDVAQVLAAQPRPQGPRVAVVGNSDALALLSADVATGAGLELAAPPCDLGPDATAGDYADALAGLDRAATDSVLVIFAPTLPRDGSDVADVIAAFAAGCGLPVVTTFVGRGAAGAEETSRAGAWLLAGSVPAFITPEAAVRALARATAYGQWRAAPAGSVPELAGLDLDAARALVRDRLAASPEGVELAPADVEALLRCAGVAVVPLRHVADADAAVAAGEELGWGSGAGVVLKATAPHVRQQPDLSHVWRSITSSGGMRTAWRALESAVGPPEVGRYAVQPMAGPGVPVEVRAEEDRLFGPLLSVGIAGVPTALLGDRAFRIPPVTDLDVAAMVREVRASPLLFGWAGRAPADVPALEQLLHRVAQLTDALPEVDRLVLQPVLVGPSDLSVVGARVRVSAPPVRSDAFTRRLGG